MTDQRLIAPTTEKWNEGERDWSYVKDPTEQIGAWEQASGKKLPDSYRRFMLKFNGGHPYPNVLVYAAPLSVYPSTEPETTISFFRWSTVEAAGGYEADRLPPDMLAIGGDPGGLVILLSVAEQNYGQIFVWVHRGAPWGSEDNDQIWLQAGSFDELIESLFDNDDRTGWDAWHIPIYDDLARPLTY